MRGVGGFACEWTWVLRAVLSLPALWWLLRIRPTAPKNIRCHAIRLLFGLENRQQTPASAPLWLVILRLTAATLVILSLAHPLLNPGAALPGQGPLVLVVDDGRSEEHTSELQSLMRISYAVFCLKKKK